MFNHVNDYLDEILDDLSNIETIVDATAGNGFDTLKLAKKFPLSKIYAFDIQSLAINNTKELLIDENIFNVELINDTHENINEYITDAIDLAVFNLGYLPKSNKKIHTQSKSTINSIECVCSLLAKYGYVFITSYPGSIRGKVEDISLIEHLRLLDQNIFNVTKINFINQKNIPPILYIIYKK
ncbi:MAG: class I SAM-dependent methyltransferase [Bacillota bacterium]|nr:class I SAM-dependent methyltransferase [Bacillota bacterium]